jgi:anti-sigma regulatory factor (Ser/Thr protein kinase)
MISRPTYHKHRSRFTWFLSLLLTMVALGVFRWMDPFPVYPYRAELVAENPGAGRGLAIADLTGDGKGEILRFVDYNDFPAIEIFNGDDVFLRTQRINGEWLRNEASFVTADIDGDGFGEIYTITLQNDSLLLNGFEPFGDNEHFMKDIFLDVTQKVNGKYDVSISFFKTKDVNGDGNKELVFVISAGYSLFPRKLYVYSPVTGKLLKTPPMGARVHSVAFTKTIEGAGQFWVSANATENFKGMEDVPYPDTSGWIFGYDHNLDSAFVALEFPDGKSLLHIFSRETENDWLLYVAVFQQNTNTNELYAYTQKGELINKQTVDFNSNMVFLNTEYPDFEFLYLRGLNTLLGFDFSLRSMAPVDHIDEIALHDPFYNTCKTAELYFGRKEDYLILTDKRLSPQGKTEINGFNNTLDFEVFKMDSLDKDHYKMGVYNRANKLFILTLQSNPWYPFRYAVSGSVFLLFFIFFHSIIMVQNHFIRKKMESEMRLVSLQIQSVQNQLQPHFTFNVLNNIAALIHKGDNEVGYRYLNGFSDMLRVVLNHSGSDKWQLGDELQFIESYLSMENLRFNDKFRNEINFTDKDLLNFSVPKLMIQTFVENSIRHGLVHKTGDCLLKISISDNEKNIRVEVVDNGIGRERSATLIRKGTGKGLYILREFMEAWNVLHIDPFSMKIHDLVEYNGVPAGTQVVVNIPKAYTM